MRTLYSKRLVLKGLSLNDADDMYEYAKVPIVGNSAGWNPHTSIKETKEIIKMMIASKEVLGIYLNNKLIGSIGLHFRNGEYDIGYVLNPNYWNKGYMTEAANIVIKNFFNTTNNNVIYGTTFKDNIGSQKVLIKLGFKYLKEIEKKVKDEVRKMDMFKLIKEDFKGE